MVFEFDHLYEFSVRRFSREDKTVFGKTIFVRRIEFVTVAMAFGNLAGAINAFGQRAFAQIAIVSSQPHRTPQVFDAEQIAQLEDHWIACVRVKLSRFGVINSTYIAGEFNRRALHPQTDTEKRFLFSPRITNRAQHSRNASFAKPSRNQNRVQIAQPIFPTFIGHQIIAFDPAKIDFDIVGKSAVDQGFVQTLVGILQLDIFADNADGHGLAQSVNAIDQRSPLPQIGIAQRQAQQIHQQLIQSLPIEHQRNFIHGFHILRRDDRVLRYVTEQRNFRLHIHWQFAFATAKQNIRLNSYAQQFFHRMLRRFGFQFTRSGQIRNQRQMHECRVVTTDFVAHLANGFQKRQRFNVAHGSPDFDNHHIVIVGNGFDGVFDFIGDVRNDLNGFPQIIAASFFFDD